MTNLNNPEDMSEDEVKEFSDLLRNQMLGVRFAKDAKFVKSKSTWAVGIAAVAVSAIAISFSLSSSTLPPTWAAEPNANAATQSLSEASCANANAAGNPINVTSTGVTSSTPSVPKDGTKMESGTSALDSTQGNASAGALPSDPKGGVLSLGSGSGTITLSSAPVVQAFDSRGKYAVTVMGGNSTQKGGVTIICLTSPSKSGTPVSGMSVISAQTGTGPTPDIFNVTTNQDGTKSAIAFGPVVDGATQVVLSAKGLPDAKATINDGSYAIWWPYDGTSGGLIEEMNAEGKIFKTINLPVGQLPEGGVFSMSTMSSSKSSGEVSVGGTDAPSSPETKILGPSGGATSSTK